MSQTWNLPESDSESLPDQRQKRADGFEALRSLHSGTSAPTSTVAYMLWADTTSGWLKQRNSANSGWNYLCKLADVEGAGVVHRVALWVTHATTTVLGPSLPANSIVIDKGLYVYEAFDSDGTDQVKFGRGSDDDAFMTATDVSSTGAKSPTSGVDVGVLLTSAATPKVTYVAGGSAPTVGKACAWIAYILVPSTPA